MFHEEEEFSHPLSLFSVERSGRPTQSPRQLEVKAKQDQIQAIHFFFYQATRIANATHHALSQPKEWRFRADQSSKTNEHVFETNNFNHCQFFIFSILYFRQRGTGQQFSSFNFQDTTIPAQLQAAFTIEQKFRVVLWGQTWRDQLIVLQINTH